MNITTYYDDQTKESAAFLDSEPKREMAWLDAHPAAILTGSGPANFISDPITA